LDLPCAPVLVDLKYNGKTIAGVAQLSKTGNVFLFRRETGEPVSKIEERAVPASTLEGEQAAATQPFLSWPEPYAKQGLTGQDIFGVDSVQYRKAKAVFDQSDVGWFIPPSTKGLLYYGIHGGSEWGGGAYDALSNTMFMNANEIAWHIKMKDMQEADEANQHPGGSVFLQMNCSNCHGMDLKGRDNTPALSSLDKKYTAAQLKNIILNGRKGMPAFPQMGSSELEALTGYLLKIKVNDKGKRFEGLRFQSLGYNKFVDEQGYPLTTPPWGTLNALDLTSGEIKWKVPLGEYAELTAKGFPVTGTENFGGCIATQGGLVFVAATRDAKIRAFDSENGKVLWEAQLPFGGYSTPATYMVNGKQYIVIPATGGGKLGTATGDTYVAFALPD
ncbi:MAG TPA: c-type cytochrome, partial [Agriterribacter sp.]|nr:c-type cytochrome [Agriterribacter sp.]